MNKNFYVLLTRILLTLAFIIALTGSIAFLFMGDVLESTAFSNF
jgi:hypothetical protein